eukprot:907030-Rhodomonas_salina.6
MRRYQGDTVLISQGPGEGHIRRVRSTPSLRIPFTPCRTLTLCFWWNQVVELAGADPKYLVLNDTYPGIDLRDPVSGTFNVIGRVRPLCSSVDRRAAWSAL